VHVQHRVPGAVGQHGGDRGGERAQRAEHDADSILMRAEDGVRVVMAPRDDQVDLGDEPRVWGERISRAIGFGGAAGRGACWGHGR